jgi:hypothetical protein
MKRTAYFIDFGYFTRCRGLGQRRWFRIFFASLQVGSGGWLISADGSTSIIQFQRKRVFTRLQGCRFIVNHVGQENWKSWKKNRVVARELPYGMCVHSHMLLRHSKGNLAADSFAHLRIYVFQLLGLWCNARICNIVKPKLKWSLSKFKPLKMFWK